jgi:hypothetical protein
MKEIRPNIPPNSEPERIRSAIEDMERRRVLVGTFKVSDGTNTAEVYDYLEIVGGVLSTVGSNGVKITLTPYYAICNLTSNLATITAETKVTPLGTSLSGFTVSSDVLTATVAGKFKLLISAPFQCTTANDVVSVGYRINGGTSVFPIQHGVRANATVETVDSETYFSLAANDTVEFRIKAVTAGSATLYAGAGFSLLQVA